MYSLEEIKALAEQKKLIGFIENLNPTVYHASPGVSKSDLDLVARSPAHYQYRKANPDQPTAAMQFGSALHCAVLEPELFGQSFIVRPADIDYRTKAGKEWRDAHAGMTILDTTTMASIEAMASKLINGKFGSLLKGGKSELSAFAFDRPTGILKRCRIDYFRSDGILIDIKTTGDASIDSFKRNMAAHRYHVQAAYYCDIISQCMDTTIDTFILLAIERDPPYALAAYRVDSDAIKQGRFEYQCDIGTLKSSILTNQWPDYPDTILDINLPRWAQIVEESL